MKKALFGLVFLATLCFLVGSSVFGYTFIKPDEPLYIQIALDMEHLHSFWIPLNHGAPDFVKPPFVYWLELVAFHIFGINIFAAKFFVWIIGILTLFFTYKIGEVVFQDKEKGLLASLLLFSNIYFFPYSQAVMMDVPLVFFVVLSTYVFILASKGKRFWLLLCGAIIGFSTLVKGPVGILLCLIPILFYAWSYNAFQPFFAKEGILFVVILLFSTLAWPLLLFAKGYGTKWFDQFILIENFGKFSGPRISFTILVTGLLLGMIPWSFFLVESFWKGVKFIRVQKEKLFFIGWIVGIFFVFLLPARKLPHYMMPAAPACALLLASETNGSTWAFWGTRILLACLGFLWLLGIRLASSFVVKLLVLAGGISLFSASFFLKDASNRLQSAFLFGIFLSIFSIVFPAIQAPGQNLAVARLEKLKKVAVFAPDDLAPKGFELSPNFSTCRTVQEAEAFLSSGGTLVIAQHDEALLASIPLQIQFSWRVWKSGVPFGVVLKAILQGNPNLAMEKMLVARQLIQKGEFTNPHTLSFSFVSL
jgi:4-amino-4-deoxy-L-arabinose transferase-like glycosyltransferase